VIQHSEEVTKYVPGNRDLNRKKKWLILGLSLVIVAIPAAKLYSDRQFDTEVSLLAQTLELKPGMTVGEIGAGKGEMTVAIAARVGPQGHVFATEIAPGLINKIRQTALEAKLNNVTVVPATVQDAGLPEGCCDVVFLRGVYHHLTQPKEIDNSLWKTLRPGGRLAVIDFPPNLLLWPWRPAGVPGNRGGHGIPKRIMIDEVTSEEFQVMRIIDPWPGGNYCVIFRKPTQILETM